MSDLISRQDAIKAIEALPNCYNGYSDAYDKACIIGTLEEVLSAEPEGNKGKWVPLQSSANNLYYQCSCCHRNAPMVETGCLMNRYLEALLTDFCPHCGADMKGERFN